MTFRTTNGTAMKMRGQTTSVTSQSVPVNAINTR
jgi:hypothetical protein